MRGGLPVGIGQLCPVAPNRDQELVERHGRVDGHLATEVVLDLILFDGGRSHVADQLGQTKNSHGAQKWHYSQYLFTKARVRMDCFDFSFGISATDRRKDQLVWPRTLPKSHYFPAKVTSCDQIMKNKQDKCSVYKIQHTIIQMFVNRKR